MNAGLLRRGRLGYRRRWGGGSVVEGGGGGEECGGYVEGECEEVEG